MQHVLITGASRGLGRALALADRVIIVTHQLVEERRQLPRLRNSNQKPSEISQICQPSCKFGLCPVVAVTSTTLLGFINFCKTAKLSSTVRPMRFLSCLDSPALAESRRRELDISRESATRLGQSAVAAATAGVYENSADVEVDFRAAVQAACAAKVNIPPDAPLPARAAAAFSVTEIQEVGRTDYEYWTVLMVRNDEGLTKTYNRFHDPEERSPDIHQLRTLHAAMDRAVLAAYGWPDIPTACEFLLDYEEDDPASPDDYAGTSDDSSARKRKMKKPSRYRWPDEIRDEVLARLLALNAERAAQEKLSGTTKGTATAKKSAKIQPINRPKRDDEMI